ncbi:hypothetical protein SISNIDRAFT_483585 [Sistotremastrum niveocremeum HHB9708]|uniref:N-acetyltransferase domain-containing protein n=2 Tax=Sistotremastraceae TaxID=3402574 RepID=A0A164XQK3_9AGAM|nr:hypothetical protein SISNIDRAFT_483585 [Sistotremastrum niveocremeum HHB9708]KZT44464.1 hypothetical protein SISSUDRAFT_976485 [Sistotremastrum suecicum HHB10207 ss-3]
MPGLTLAPTVHSYSSPAAFPQSLWDAFRAHEQDANVIYPHAQKTLRAELEGRPTPPDQLWMTVTSPDDDTPDLVLSCTSWALGTYPVFIFSTHPISTLSSQWINTRIHLLASELYSQVPAERIYSVFAPSAITKAFVRIWESISGMVAVRDPYYAASISHCTRQTFRNRRSTMIAGTSYELRKGVESDIPEVAELCRGFASTSDPFILDEEGAFREATELITQGQLWVHEINIGSSRGIASIVATTRQSDGVSAITKVYTNPLYRSRGCAERLVRRVCQHLLLQERKKSVVLYVAHDNIAAAKVYDRVGFAGLCGKPKVDGVHPWLEVGFHNTELGHW